MRDGLGCSEGRFRIISEDPGRGGRFYMEIISIHTIEGFRIGHAQNESWGTGCTVVISDEGAAAGVSVRGGGPASRETELLSPTANADCIHALLLSGGSAYGLGAAQGVMEYLRNHGIGFDTGFGIVPLVCASCIFDLPVGTPDTWPDPEMANRACVDSENHGVYDDSDPEKADKEQCHGGIGGGTGATVGKLLGTQALMKSGIGSYAVQLGDLKMGAVVIVNALGDVFDPDSGEQIAGLLTDDHCNLRNSEALMYKMYEEQAGGQGMSDGAIGWSSHGNDDGGNGSDDGKSHLPAGNTTIGVILTNADFNKTDLTRIADMTHNGLARTIRPVHTMADGDTVYAMASGTVKTNVDLAGTLAAKVMAEAVKDAVLSVKTAYGAKAAADL